MIENIQINASNHVLITPFRNITQMLWIIINSSRYGPMKFARQHITPREQIYILDWTPCGPSIGATWSQEVLLAGLKPPRAVNLMKALPDKHSLAYIHLGTKQDIHGVHQSISRANKPWVLARLNTLSHYASKKGITWGYNLRMREKEKERRQF